MRALSNIKRKLGLYQEQLFWRRWINSPHGASLLPLAELLDPDRPFPPYLRPMIDDLPEPELKILDVGAGPCTHLGRRHPSKTIKITATDILAPGYRRMLARKGVTPPVETVYADAEALTDIFPPDSFDLAVANNCLDHCAEPRRAVAEMLRVVKPGRRIVLRHRENEAERTGYRGLHTWNFYLHDGKPMLRRGKRNIDLAEQFLTAATCEIMPEPDHVVIVLRRHAPNHRPPHATATRQHNL